MRPKRYPSQLRRDILGLDFQVDFLVLQISLFRAELALKHWPGHLQMLHR